MMLLAHLQGRILPRVSGAHYPAFILLTLWMTFLPQRVDAQAPLDATLTLPGDTSSGWQLPATVTLTVTGSAQSSFNGSNGGPERGSPLFSKTVEAGATYYACDTVVGFPPRLSPNSPNINRRGRSSFIAVKTSPAGFRKTWICASVGAYRLTSPGIESNWEYQIRYYSGDPDAGVPSSMVIGTVPNADIFAGQTITNSAVVVRYPELPDLSALPLPEGLKFAEGFIPGSVGTIGLIITNIGPAKAAGMLGFATYASVDAKLDPFVDLLLSLSPPILLDLPKGASISNSLGPIRIPASMPPDGFYFIVRLDPDGLILEAEENNNLLVLPAKGLPDLSGGVVELSLPPRLGASGYARVGLTNTGTLAANGNARMSVYLSLDTILNPAEDIRLAEPINLKIDNLFPKNSISLRFDQLEIPKSLKPGTYTLLVGIDEANTIEESKEDNNLVVGPQLQIRGYTVSGEVKSQLEGLPIESANLLLYHLKDRPGGSPAFSKTTAANGKYQIPDIPPGLYVLSPEKEGWQFITPGSANAPASPNVIASVLLEVKEDMDIDPILGTRKIQVKSIKTPFTGFQYFLSGVSLETVLTIVVDWGDHMPGNIVLSPLNQALPVQQFGQLVGSVGIYTLKRDVGRDFLPYDPPTFVARSSDGAESEPKEAEFVVMPRFFGSSLFAKGVRVNLLNNTRVRYEFEIEPNLGFLEDTFGWDAPEIDADVPLLGESKLGLAWLPSVEGEVSRNEAEMTLSLGGPEFSNEVDPQMTFGWDSPWSRDFEVGIGVDFSWKGIFEDRKWKWEASFGFSPELSLAFSRPLPAAIPTPIGPIPLYVDASLEIGGSAMLSMAPADEWPGFYEGASLRDYLNGEYEVELTGKLGVGAGVNDTIGAEFWGKAGGTWEIQLPAPRIKKWTGFVAIGGTFDYLLGSYTTELARWEWPDPPAPTGPRLASQPFLTFQPTDRSYLNSQDYGGFNPRPSDRQAIIQADTPNGTVPAFVLQTNVFPRSYPSLGSDGTNTLAFWIYDSPTRDAANRTSVVFSRHDGSRWSSPSPVADDGTADFSPVCKVFGDGRAIAVWENAKTILPPDSDPAAMVPVLEIASAVLDRSSLQWRSLPSITSNGYLDRSPRLAGREFDDLMAVWLANPSGHLLGGPTNENHLMASRWNGRAWSTPTLVANIPRVIYTFDMVYENGVGHVVLSVDAPGSFRGSEDQELFMTSLSGGAWSAIRQLTSDSVPDGNPRLGRDPEGKTILVWLKGGDLSSAADFRMDQRTVIYGAEYSPALGNFSLSQGPDGTMALLWAGFRGVDSDVYAAFFDPIGRVWGRPRAITRDAEVERGLAGAWVDRQTIYALYNRYLPGETNITIRGIEGRPTTVAIPTRASRTDLAMLAYSPHADPAMKTNRLDVSPPEGGPGLPLRLRATVINQGDLLASNLTVVLRRRNREGNWEELARTNLGVQMRTGDTIPVVWDWTPPSSTTPIVVEAIVDPEEAQADWDRRNNLASIQLGAPDIRVEDTAWDSSDDENTVISSSVVNVGTLPSAPTTVELRQGSAAGSLLQSYSVPAMDPGARTNFVFRVSPGASGRYLVIARTGGGETSEANNSSALTIHRELQISVVSGPQPQPDGTVLISVRGAAGEHYALEHSTDLITWIEHGSATSTGMALLFVDDFEPSAPPRFYRARRKP